MRSSGPAREPVLRTSVQVLRRRKRVIAFCTLLVVAAALGYSVLQTPVYAATAEVVLRTGDPGSRPAASSDEAARATRTEILIVESPAVRRLVEEQLGSKASVSVSQAGDTDVIRIRAEDPDPGRAVQVADTYASTFVQVRTRQLADELAKAKSDIETKLTELDQRAQALPPGPEKDRLAAERDQQRDRANQVELDAALSDSYVKVLTPATAPGSPAEPRTLRNVLFALGAGLLIGVFLAILFEALDDSVASSAQLEVALRDISVLAVIPAADPGWRGRDQLVTLRDAESSTAEAYRRLRTALQFLARDSPMQSLQVTSPNSMQGKTTTAANLGVVLAQAGLSVVVVCCDLRRPRMHELFEIPNQPGFTSVLNGEVPLSAAIREEPTQPGLAVLPSGPLPSTSSELLASQRTVEVLTSLQAAYDVVLLDTPPVLTAADAVVLSRRVDATLIVSVAGVTTRRDAARAAEALRLVDAPLVGAVLHGAEVEAIGDELPFDDDEDGNEIGADVIDVRSLDS